MTTAAQGTPKYVEPTRLDLLGTGPYLRSAVREGNGYVSGFCSECGFPRTFHLATWSRFGAVECGHMHVLTEPLSRCNAVLLWDPMVGR